MAKYTYSPIDSQSNEIRLLELQPGRYGAPLNGLLRVVKLGDKPKYEALSYTWGPIVDDKYVTLDGTATLTISDNLSRALQRLRYRWRKRVLWIDQICINQSDIDERNAQGAFMGDIYGGCDECAIWLRDVDEALIIRPALFTHLQQVWAMWLRTRYSDQHVDRYPLWGVTSSSNRKPLNNQLFWSTTAALFSSKFHILHLALTNSSPSWIDRSWVRQEFCLSRRQCFYFGSRLLRSEWHAFRVLFEWLRPQAQEISDPDHVIQEFMGRIVALRALRDNLAILTGRSLLLLLSLEPELQVSDPKDKVYSLLSLLSHEEKSLLRADYSLPCSGVFARATFNTMQGSMPGFACFAFNAHIAVSTHIDGLPTWAIDFSNLKKKRDSLYADSQPVLMDQRCRPSVSVDPGWTVLSINAIPLDFIESSFSMSFSEITDLDQERLTPLSFAQKIAKAIDQSHSAKDRPWHRNLTRLEHIKQFVLGQRSQRPCEPIDQNLGPSMNDDLSPTLYDDSSRNLTPQDFPDGLNSLWEYCMYANDVTKGCIYFVTNSRHVGLGLTLLERGDKLVYPIFDCEHNRGSKIDRHDFWYQPVIALCPREDQWVFRGVVHLVGLKDMDLDASRVEQFDIC